MSRHSPRKVSSFASPKRAIRVTISYHGRELRVVSRKILSKRTPPSHSLDASERRAGFWFQVEDVNGRLLYRRVMHNPIQFAAETLSNDPERPFKRVPLPETRGTFSILIPVLPKGHTVRVFSSPPEIGKDSAPAEEVLSFKVTESIVAPQSNEKDEPANDDSDQDDASNSEEQEE